MKLFYVFIISIVLIFVLFLLFTSYTVFFINLVIILVLFLVRFVVFEITGAQANLKDSNLFFWSLFSILISAPFIIFIIILISSNQFENSSYFSSILSSILLISTVSLIIGIFILLFKRNLLPSRKKTLAAMSLVIGLWFFLIIGISGFVFLRMGSSVPSPDAIDISYKSEIAINDEDNYKAMETFVIKPLDDTNPLGIKEIDNGEISKSEIKEYSKFAGGTFEGKPLNGIKLTLFRNLPIERQDIGLLQSKIIISPPNLSLLYKNEKQVKAGDVRDAAIDSSIGELNLSYFSKKNSEFLIEMPKNSILITNPKSDIAFLPDKDVVNLKTTNSNNKIEIYYLKQNFLRLKILKDFLMSDSYFDTVMKILQFLFLPIILFMIGAFQEKIKDIITGIFSKAKKPKRIGF